MDKEPPKPYKDVDANDLAGLPVNHRQTDDRLHTVLVNKEGEIVVSRLDSGHTMQELVETRDTGEGSETPPTTVQPDMHPTTTITTVPETTSTIPTTTATTQPITTTTTLSSKLPMPLPTTPEFPDHEPGDPGQESHGGSTPTAES